MEVQNANFDIDLKLIEIIKANPILYEKNVRSVPYNCLKNRAELWRSIAVSLGVDTRYCIMRWKTLRDRFRKAVAKSCNDTTAWPHMEKLRFLEKQTNSYGLRQTKGISQPQKVAKNWQEMDAEQLIEEIDPLDAESLQEAMDESALVTDKLPVVPVISSTQNISNPVYQVVERDMPNTSANMKRRMEVLLEGLDGSNRIKAEKRIVAYLCKCQLKTLNDEDVDDVVV